MRVRTPPPSASPSRGEGKVGVGSSRGQAPRRSRPASDASDGEPVPYGF